jgi:hypothetical protein
MLGVIANVAVMRDPGASEASFLGNHPRLDDGGFHRISWPLDRCLPTNCALAAFGGGRDKNCAAMIPRSG